MPEVPSLPPEATGGLRSFNLLPWRTQQHRARQHQALALLACGVVAALALLAGIELPLRHQLRAENQRLEPLRTSISLARRGAANRDELETKRTQASALLAEVNRIRQANLMALDWLTALPAEVPAGVRLTGLNLDKSGWQLRGLAQELNQPAALLERVRQMPMVADVRMDQLQSNPDALRQFQLAGRLVNQ